MADTKHIQDTQKSEVIVEKAKDFWTRNSKVILGIGGALLLLVGGYFIYKNYFKEPKEQKATEAMFKAEQYFRKDSLKLALNGDGQNLGFLKVISNYSGTAAANLAHFYAGAIYVKLDDNQNAVTQLKKFDGEGADQITQRAYKLLGDAYGNLGNFKEALDSYKKSAHTFEADKAAAAESLFHAAYLADKVLKDQKEAIELYKELKEKYPQTQQGYQADKFLAQLGVYNAN